MLQRMVERETADEIELSNASVIQVVVSSHRSVRGFTAACVICDECAFWGDTDSDRDSTETRQRPPPYLATLPGSLLIGISSPYAQARRAVAELRAALWQGRPHAGLAGADAAHEPGG